MSTRGTEIEIAQSLLKEMGHESLLSYFTRRLTLGKELASRPLILAAFARLAGPSSKQHLVSIINDLTESTNTRVIAAKALGDLARQTTEASERSELTHILINLLDDNTIEFRSAVATQLAGLRAQEAVNLLQKMLEADKLDVLAREEVQSFLATIVTPSIALPIPQHSLIGRRAELQRLRDAFSQSQVVALVGMGGVGKSALAASFVQQSNYDVKVWRSCRYSVDPADLVNSLLVQIKQDADPNADFSEEQVHSRFDWGRIQNQIINLLMDRSALIVLDDYETQIEENELMNLINRLTTRLPKIHWLIVGRVVPSMLTGSVIRLEGLSLNDSYEFLRVAAERGAISLDSDTAESIVKLADGNSLLLSLYISALNQGLSVEEVLSTGREKVIHSIISRALQSLTASQRRTVELLSQFEEPISPNQPEINELFEREGVGSLSECLQSITQLSFVVSDSGGSLALHNLVRPLIRSNTDKRTTIRVNRSLGAFYKKRGHVLRAATHFIRGELIDQAIQVFNEHLIDIINQGHVISALEVLDSISVPNELKPTVKIQFFSSLGFLSRFHGKHQRAVESYERVLQLARELGNRREESLALSQLGRAYTDVGSISAAISCYEGRLRISREIGDRRSEGIALGSLGRIYSSLGAKDQAIEYYEKRLSIAREIGDRSGEAAAMGNLGRAYADLGAIDKAIEYYVRRLEITREIGNRKGEGLALGDLGRVYAKLGSVEQAIDCYERRLAIARRLGDRRDEGVALSNIGRIHLDIGEIDKAIECYEKRLQIALEIGDPRGEGGALNSLGGAYFRLGAFEKAIDYYERRLLIARDISDRKTEASTLGSLGKVYAELNAFDKAITCNEARLEISREIQDLAIEAGALGSLGRIHTDLGNIDRAIEYYEKQLLVAREIGDARGQAGAIAALAASYAVIGNLQRAIELYDQALEVTRKIGDRLGEGNMTAALGKAYGSLGQTERAIQFFQQQIEIARTFGNRRGEGAGLFNISLASEQAENLKQAITYAEEALGILEKIKDPTAKVVREKLENWRKKEGA
jgi:tetratricopeptide (TPR) repeat protein